MSELLMAMLNKLSRGDKIELTKLAIELKLEEIRDLELALTVFEMENEAGPGPGETVH